MLIISSTRRSFHRCSRSQVYEYNNPTWSSPKDFKVKHF